MEQQLSEVHLKYIETIRLKKYSILTEKYYLWHWLRFDNFKKPKHYSVLSSQDIRDYLVHLNSHDCSDSFFNQAINAIRFMFKKCLLFLYRSSVMKNINPLIITLPLVQSCATGLPLCLVRGNYYGK